MQQYCAVETTTNLLPARAPADNAAGAVGVGRYDTMRRSSNGKPIGVSVCCMCVNIFCCMRFNKYTSCFTNIARLHANVSCAHPPASFRVGASLLEFLCGASRTGKHICMEFLACISSTLYRIGIIYARCSVSREFLIKVKAFNLMLYYIALL